MALFAFWRDDPAGPAAAALHARVAGAAHIVAERTTAAAVDTAGGRWRLAAFAAATRFYAAEAQVWQGEAGGGACAIHGIIWRMEGGAARLLDAAAVAALLPEPASRLPDDVAGEYAVARLHRCGTLTAFADPAGIHQLFHFDPERPGLAAVASRAAFLAALAGDHTVDPEAGLWLAATGFRVGTATGWRGVRQLPQARRLHLAPDRTAGGAAGGAATLERLPDPAIAPAARGMAGGERLLDEGIAQAVAAARLAAGDGAVELPVTGGKDSRAVLALCLAAGLRDRLTLVTRGRADHPDVVAAAGIAAALGLPHRREPPQGSDAPPELDVAGFVERLATHAWQTDGGMGGWDLLIGTHTDTGTLITGHMGEVLKAAVKRPVPAPMPAAMGAGLGAGPDPIDIVRAQAPFDPLGLLRPAAGEGLAATLAAQMAEARGHEAGAGPRAGAREDDLPDLFYYRNRVPNWLGGIRGVRSHERQPVMPLGVPALQRLAFRLTPAERRAELLHWRILAACAPELAGLPFAHQSWSAALPDAPRVAPLLAPAGTSLFGGWQWSLNRTPAIRAWLGDFLDRTDLALWEGIDRRRLREALAHRRFDYHDAIGLLGLVAAAFHGAGLVRRQRIGGPAAPPVDPGMLRGILPSDAVAGHLDGVGGAGRLVAPGRLAVSGAGAVTLGGWAWVPARPGATAMVAALADGLAVARVAAEGDRPDLAAAGIGHGRYGFTLTLDAGLLAGAAVLELPGIAGGRLAIEREAAP